MAAAKQMIPTN